MKATSVSRAKVDDIRIGTVQPASARAAPAESIIETVPAEQVATVNGVPLHEPGARPDEATLRELAWTELMRQQAVDQGRLPAATGQGVVTLAEADHEVLIQMVDEQVQIPLPSEDECRRYFEAHKQRYVVGQARQVRHILFAVTPGIDVSALAVHAERALAQLSARDVDPGLFASLAGQLSNCPSGAHGGELGWLTPDDCAPELANELFYQKEAHFGLGLHPRLVHTRYGLHIIEVLDHRAGHQPAYEQVREQIHAQLCLAARGRAQHQYMQLLVGQARIVGVELKGAASPLVQ
ncbi:MAG: peptidylprolyl isomerase [Burkholderiaceae bacterium]